MDHTGPFGHSVPGWFLTFWVRPLNSVVDAVEAMSVCPSVRRMEAVEAWPGAAVTLSRTLRCGATM